MNTDRRSFLKFLGIGVLAAATGLTIKIDLDDEVDHFGGVDPGPVAPAPPPQPDFGGQIFKSGKKWLVYGRPLPRHMNMMLLEDPVAIDLSWGNVRELLRRNTPIAPGRNRVHPHIRVDTEGTVKACFGHVPEGHKVGGVVTFIPDGTLITYHPLTPIVTNGGDIEVSFGERIVEIDNG